MKENIIYIYQTKLNNYKLFYPKYHIKTKAYIGKNGLTENKQEGDLKTPIGTFDIGIKMSIKPHKNCLNITKNHYWIDDINSKYYNQLVDIKNTKKDWNSAEHLIDYKKTYQYLIEIKTNPNNIPGKGSAIFLHCKTKKYTHGCIAIKKKIMKKLINLVDTETKICISKQYK